MLRKRFVYVVVVSTLSFVALACGGTPAVPPTTRPPDTPVALEATQVPESTLSEEEISEIVERVLAQLEAGEPAEDGILPLFGAPEPQTQYLQFVEFVRQKLATYWADRFTRAGLPYQNPQVWVVEEPGPINHGQIAGRKSAEEGPFYNAGDESIYMASPSLWLPKLATIGDFADAYIVAHEWGHHVQKLSGIYVWYQERKKGADLLVLSDLSKRYELQADCLAGTWANSEYYLGSLGERDIKEAMTMAHALGDDVLNPGAGPSPVDHGTAEERKIWFMYGYNNGKPELCDPFAVAQQPTPEPLPTSVPGGTVRSFWLYASDPACFVVDDGVPTTVETVRCPFTDNVGNFAIDYDEWVSEQAWLDYINERRVSEEVGFDGTWRDPTGTYTGSMLVWYHGDTGQVFLMLGVYGTRTSATMYWYSGDLQAAMDWFLSQ